MARQRHDRKFWRERMAKWAGSGLWAQVGAAWNVPVLVDEFGTSNTTANAEELMAAHFAAFDALGISGSEWEYSTSVDTWNSETDSIAASDGGLLPVSGAVARPFARAVAGSAIAQSFDDTAKTYTLAYVSAPGGTTEVSLPAAPYPAGYALTLTGACADSISPPGACCSARPPTPAAPSTSRSGPLRRSEATRAQQSSRQRTHVLPIGGHAVAGIPAGNEG